MILVIKKLMLWYSDTLFMKMHLFKIAQNVLYNGFIHIPVYLKYLCRTVGARGDQGGPASPPPNLLTTDTFYY